MGKQGRQERSRHVLQMHIALLAASMAAAPRAGCFSLGPTSWIPRRILGYPPSKGNVREIPSILQVRSGPAPGEVRNPWGRAGKPETRAARRKEAEENIELRAKAWRIAMDRDGEWDEENTALTDYVNDRDIDKAFSTADIEDFHERAIALLRESGGRMNSLTFGYKWEQQYGESLAGFARLQRLSVAELLRQSNRFWVVDMQGTTTLGDGGDEEDGGPVPMQVFVLVDKPWQHGSRGQRLGDQLSMHGESEAIKQWKQRRATGTISRTRSVTPLGREEFDLAADVVGVPGDAAAAVGSYVVHEVSGDRVSMGCQQVQCIEIPKKVAAEKRLTALLDLLEPSISNVDSRLGFRQMHVAWAVDCSCASSAVRALTALKKLQSQARGRQIRRLDDQLRSFADVVQSGSSSLRVVQLAEAVDAVQGRTGYENLYKLVAARLLHPDVSVRSEADSIQPWHIATLVEALSGAQRDPTLYRKIAGICMQIRSSSYTVDDIAHILEGYETAGVRDKQLQRHMAAILQTMPPSSFSARGISSLSVSLSLGGSLDDSALRSLSFAAQQLSAAEYTTENLSSMMTAFAAADVRDARLFRHFSGVAQAFGKSAYDSETIARVSLAAAKAGGGNDEALFGMLGEAVVGLKCSAYTPDTVGRIAKAFTESTAHKVKIYEYLSLVVKKMDAWTFDMESVACLVDAYSKAAMRDTELFARLSTILQQMDPVMFSLASIATVANAYTNPEVFDKALLGRLANIIQQMDSKVVSGPEAVPDVSVILNAYARADMRETALALSHTLTNHLKPHVGGLTAQAMANIVLRVGVA